MDTGKKKNVVSAENLTGKLQGVLTWVGVNNYLIIPVGCMWREKLEKWQAGE